MLLLEGANRRALDNDGLSPIDFARAMPNERDRNELMQILADSGGCACLQLRTPMKRV